MASHWQGRREWWWRELDWQRHGATAPMRSGPMPAPAPTPRPGPISAPGPPKPQQLDLRPRSNSNCINAGGPLTFAENNGSNSTQLKVDDTVRFCDGFGIKDGDMIRIGSGEAVEIVKTLYMIRNQGSGSNVITLTDTMSWSKGALVFLDYNGEAPDIKYWESDHA